MESFTPISSTIGGVLIGLSLALVLLFQGRIAGISGICGGMLGSQRGELGWRGGFVAGLLAVGAIGVWLSPAHFATAGTAALPFVALAGLLVGFGTRLGNGCTSGHGVCGISRLSSRSLVVTGIFMAAAAATVFVTRHVLGGEA